MAAAVEVCVGVLQELLAVHVQAVYVVPGVAHVALDPLHRVLLGQAAPGGRARLHPPDGRHFLLLLVILGGRRGGGAGGGGGRGSGGGRGRGRGGQGGPGREGVLPGATSSFTFRRKKTTQTGRNSVRFIKNKQKIKQKAQFYILTGNNLKLVLFPVFKTSHAHRNMLQ